MRASTASLVAVAWLVGCGGSGGGAKPSADAPTDATPDAPALTDAAPPADVGGPESATHDLAPTDGPEVSPDVWPPVKGETAWLSLDDDAAVGALDYAKTPDAVHEIVRFEVEQPVRLWGLRAQLSVPSAAVATLYLWDDLGGDFLSMDVAKPLAVLERAVTPADDGVWLDFPLPEPLDLVPGRMFFAGAVVTGEGAIQLRLDAATAEIAGKATTSFLWLASEPPDELGFPAYQLAPGDFMLRAEVSFLGVVPEPARDFEPLAPEALGIPGLSRVAMADVDGDGDLDVMTDGPRLYLNDGLGAFTDATATGLVGLSGHNGGVFGDFDNDGDPDYFATGHKAPMDRLLRNDGGTFTDVTPGSGLDDTQHFNCNGDEGEQPVPTEAAAWLDFDNDGWLDLYQGNFICWDPPAWPSRDILWRNRGDGTFEDVTATTGVSMGQPQATRGVAPADANGDGRQDILATNYRLNKNLYFESYGADQYKGAGSPSLLEGTWDPGNAYGHSIGAAWGDLDADGDLDVFIAKLAHPRFLSFSDKAAMYLNPGGPDAVFVEVTEQVGLRYQETPSNPNLFDYDSDGDLDLFYTCIYEHRGSQLYRNDGHPAWREVSYETGLRVYNGWGSAVGDVDGDGDLDLLAAQSFRNRNPSGHGAVLVRVEGLGAGHTNRDGLGARVTATVGAKLVLRERVGAHGTGVQDSPWLHVGLGDVPSADLTVTFPATGAIVNVPSAAAGSRWHVREDGLVEADP